jgi:hypothetical protein
MYYWAIKIDNNTTFCITEVENLVEAGIAFDYFHLLSRKPEPFDVFNWDTLVLTTPIQAAQDSLIAKIEAHRYSLSKIYLVLDPTKQLEYQRKGTEALNDTGPWPWLEELAYQKGTTVEDERLEVMSAMDIAEIQLRAISATALTAKAAIRSASTIEQKKAIYDAIIWPNIDGE